MRVLNKEQSYKNDCIDTYNLAHYRRTFAAFLAERRQRYNISGHKRNDRGKKRWNCRLRHDVMHEIFLPRHM